MRKRVLLCVAMVAVIGLTGCAGIWNGLGNDPMTMIVLTKTLMPGDEGTISYTQFLAVWEVAREKKGQIDGQMSSVAEACFSGFWPYGIAGAAGGSSGGILYPNAGVLTGPMAGVSGLTYGFGGCVNGAVTYSYAQVYALGASVEQALRDHEKDSRSPYRDPVTGRHFFHNVHVVASFVRSLNGFMASNPPPRTTLSGMQQRPQWGGPPAGRPVQQYQRYAPQQQYAPPPQAPYPVPSPPQ